MTQREIEGMVRILGRMHSWGYINYLFKKYCNNNYEIDISPTGIPICGFIKEETK